MLRSTPLILVLAQVCACTNIEAPESTEELSTQLYSDRIARAETIRAEASAFGLRNGALLLAGIANAETGLAHCWRDATWACQGPSSQDCNGGPVISGAGDGPCWWKEGGLGMFQFDAGTHSATLAREGYGILSLRGNVRSAVQFVINMVINSDRISGVSTPNEAVAFLNRAMPGTREYDAWLAAVVQSYNGCTQGRCSVFWSRYDHYDARTRDIQREFGHDFWRRSYQEEPPGDAGDGSGAAYKVPPGGSCWDAANALGCSTGEVVNCTANRACNALAVGDELRCGSCSGGADPGARADSGGRTHTVASGGSCWDAAEALQCDVSSLVNCSGSRSCASLWAGDQLACSYNECP